MTDHKFTDEQIIKALECCRDFGDCSLCPYEGATFDDDPDCAEKMHTDALALINRQKAVEDNLRKRIDDLEHTLAGVMWSVDKWLDGTDLKQDEVKRAIRMREKTLEIVERLEEENEFLKSLDENKIRAEAIKKFAERVKAHTRHLFSGVDVAHIVDELVEMTEVDNG